MKNLKYILEYLNDIKVENLINWWNKYTWLEQDLYYIKLPTKKQLANDILDALNYQVGLKFNIVRYMVNFVVKEEKLNFEEVENTLRRYGIDNLKEIDDWIKKYK